MQSTMDTFASPSNNNFIEMKPLKNSENIFLKGTLYFQASTIS